MNDYESIKLIIPRSWPQWMVERYLSLVSGFHDEVCSQMELTRAAKMVEDAYEGEG
jgi:hypothetical protein